MSAGELDLEDPWLVHPTDPRNIHVSKAGGDGRPVASGSTELLGEFLRSHVLVLPQNTRPCCTPDGLCPSSLLAQLWKAIGPGIRTPEFRPLPLVLVDGVTAYKFLVFSAPDPLR